MSKTEIQQAAKAGSYGCKRCDGTGWRAGMACRCNPEMRDPSPTPGRFGVVPSATGATVDAL